MKILIIGGKQFVGYHIANAAIKQGHDIVFFNRGRTNSELFPEYENIIGDRNTDMDKLQDMEFDYVIDTCAYYPHQVEKSLDVLEGHFKKYLLISTLSVITTETYNHDETVKKVPTDYTSTEINAKSYGELKSACEEVLENRIGEKGIIIRPGYIVGDMDYTDRFTYYAIMMHYNDEVIMPKTNNLNYSFVDGKDLGKFVIHALDTNLSGIYHTVGPDNLTFEGFIELTRAVVNPSCKIHYVDDNWFKENGEVKHLAFPTCNDNEAGKNVFAANTSKAKQAGFTIRPVEDSIKDGLEYFIREKNDITKLKVGMPIDKMKQYLNRFED